MTTNKHAETSDPYRYEKIAGRIEGLIKKGTYRAGERIPSVRSLSRQMKVSISTVLKAYFHLENQGIIEARPQSGYYVRQQFPKLKAEAEIPLLPAVPTHVSVNELVMMIMRDARNSDLVPLGVATPNPENLPVDKLNRILSTISRRFKFQGISYDFPPGCEKLRIQLAQRAMTAGCSLTPDSIVVTSGCLEAVMLSLRAVCKPGDTVAIESPVFYNLLQVIEMLDLKALEIPTHPQTGMSLSALRYAVEHNPVHACLVISNFNNPYGSCMPDDKKKELVRILAGHDIPLIEDDVYGDLGFSYDRPRVAKRYDKKGLVILCSSFSKTLAPGYRVGWVAAGRFQEKIERLKAVSNIATATLPQLAIAEFLANGGYDQYLRRIRGLYARQTSLMAQEVKRHFPRGTEVNSPSGGFVIWVEMPEYVDSIKLYGQALKMGITIAPGLIFSASRKYRNFIRLNAAYWSERIEKSLAVIGELASTMRK
ncbi:MAG TPA: PLP-dependent aminotransferase family protein [Geobacteraceae bacterium]|nr:PLP-dependent aminotransferase family protein [Geobacteraceae bacterium]